MILHLAVFFTLGRNCVLQSIEEKSKRITYKNERIYTDEIKQYVLQCKHRIKLEIQHDHCLFTIDNRFVISKITLPDLVKDTSDYETANDYFDNEFTIRAGQCSEIINALIETLGEQESSMKEEAA